MKLKVAFGLWLLANSLQLAGQNVLWNIIHTDSIYLKYKFLFLNPEKYHLQVIYTQVNHEKNKKVILKKYSLYPATSRYYYPASLVKLPLSALALEKLHELKIKALTKDSRLCVDSNHTCELKETSDTTATSKYPSIAQYIKRMLLVSDNDAYSRVYEFLTPEYINQKLHNMGYESITINQRLQFGCDSTDNRYTNGFIFFDKDSTIIYSQLPACYRDDIRNHATHTIIGKGFKSGNKILPPKDFRRNNYIPFEDENAILLSLVYPKSVSPFRRFDSDSTDYSFLLNYLGMLPRESSHPTYDTSKFPDNFKKYNYFGTDRIITDTNIRSYNIVGRAYGFFADCSYIKDSKTGTEFFLSILLYVNKKNILNTGEYEYDSIGLPFMSDMGHAVYNYELKRMKKKN